MTLEGSLSHDTGVIHADLTVNYSEPQEEHSLDDTVYTLLPQTPSEVDSICAVTVNFPATILIGPPNNLGLSPDSPPEYSEWTEVWQEHDWNQLPLKFQPPSFRIHRCHHRGVERGGEDDAFELPLGFPEILHHIDEACNDVCNTQHVHESIGKLIRIGFQGYVSNLQSVKAVPASRRRRHAKLWVWFVCHYLFVVHHSEAGWRLFSVRVF